MSAVRTTADLLPLEGPRFAASQGELDIGILGPLVLFSTESGDAWMLDPADRLAARLARGVVYFSTATNRRSGSASWSIIAPPFILAAIGWGGYHIPQSINVFNRDFHLVSI